MKNLLTQTSVDEILSRIDTLKPSSQALWGEMTVDQMLAHCSAALKMATGDTALPRPLIGKLIGGFLKSMYSNDKPFGKNSPTDKSVKITDARNFEEEKQKLKTAVLAFHSGGEGKITRHPHPFFGKLSPSEWSTGMYKHLDHHLRQFGA
ncbi:MAG TPA: DUF1569 domain-containing protein [Bacteroidia bacterium]|jgi:hypothetical protein|nr:DUF1569 domain-containing protein [Bacteroidia bacterium]